MAAILWDCDNLSPTTDPCRAAVTARRLRDAASRLGGGALGGGDAAAPCRVVLFRAFGNPDTFARPDVVDALLRAGVEVIPTGDAPTPRTSPSARTSPVSRARARPAPRRPSLFPRSDPSSRRGPSRTRAPGPSPNTPTTRAPPTSPKPRSLATPRDTPRASRKTSRDVSSKTRTCESTRSSPRLCWWPPRTTISCRAYATRGRSVLAWSRAEITSPGFARVRARARGERHRRRAARDVGVGVTEAYWEGVQAAAAARPVARLKLAECAGARRVWDARRAFRTTEDERDAWREERAENGAGRGGGGVATRGDGRGVGRWPSRARWSPRDAKTSGEETRRRRAERRRDAEMRGVDSPRCDTNVENPRDVRLASARSFSLSLARSHSRSFSLSLARSRSRSLVLALARSRSRSFSRKNTTSPPRTSRALADACGSYELSHARRVFVIALVGAGSGRRATKFSPCPF